MAPLGGLNSFSSVLTVLRTACGSRCKVPSSLTCSEEKEAEHLLKYLSVETALSCVSNANQEGSDPGSSREILGRSLKQGEYSRRRSEIDLSSTGVQPILSEMDLFANCLLERAREMDLSKELHLLTRIEREDLSLAICTTGRPSNNIELAGLLSELDQLVLERTNHKGGMQKPPSLQQLIRLPCEFTQILSTLVEALTRHLILAARTLYDRRIYEAGGDYEILSSRFLVDGLWAKLKDYDVVAAKAKGDRLRNQFLEKAALKPPPVLRMIDCIASCNEGQVVLMDWKDCVQAWRYSAISHTFGQDVYKAFDCTCASICRVTSKPRCSFDTCPHDPAASSAANTTQTRVVQDILRMCGHLCKAGVHYAWHDGVCIAQHDRDEVRQTIQHIGWIYSSGKETIIFLHYVGEPRAPIWLDVSERACRWLTRAWTLQEAALSKRRRYCIRVGKKAIGEWQIQSLADMVKNVRLWYEDESSSVEVVEEESFYEIVKSLTELILGISSNLDPFDKLVIVDWRVSLQTLLDTLHSTCFSFPTIDEALGSCPSRESKHRGDRMNSILTLAEVKDFVALKDTDVEAHTLDFFKKQGQKGLARALFSTSTLDERLDYPANEPQRHKWLPVLGKSFCYAYKEGLENEMRLTVLGNGRLEVRSSGNEAHDAVMYCKKVRIVKKPRQHSTRAELDFNDHLGSDAVTDALRLLIKKAAEGDQNCVSSSVLDIYYVALYNAFYLPEAPSYPVGLFFSNLIFKARPVSPNHNTIMDDASNQSPVLMEDEESFDAHLVTTGTHYINDTASQMLLLHGDDILSGEVSKLGVFVPAHPRLFKSFMLSSGMKLEKVILN